MPQLKHGPDTKCTDEAKQTTADYIAGGYREHGHAIPTVGGLSLVLGYSKVTLYNWAKRFPDYQALLDRLKETQEIELLSQGLRGEYNAALTKLILSNNHGYSEKSAVDHQSSDGSMTPKVIERVVVDPSDPDA